MTTSDLEFHQPHTETAEAILYDYNVVVLHDILESKYQISILLDKKPYVKEISNLDQDGCNRILQLSLNEFEKLIGIIPANKQKIELCWNTETGVLSVAILEIDGKKHVTADIRQEDDRMTICTSWSTCIEQNVNTIANENRIQKLVETGVYRKEVLEVETTFERGSVISYTTFMKNKVN